MVPIKWSLASLCERSAMAELIRRLQRTFSEESQTAALKESGPPSATDPLFALPPEVMLMVLDHVPPHDIITRCRLVCRGWRCLLDDPQFWQLRMARSGNYDPRLATIVPAGDVRSWHRLVYYTTQRPNLIRSFGPDGRLSLEPWRLSDRDWNRFKSQLKPNQGQGGGRRQRARWGSSWSMENAINPAEPRNAELLRENGGSQGNYVTSYEWCCRDQFVDLRKYGFSQSIIDTLQPIIEVSEWFCPRHDCGSIYNLKVDLLDNQYHLVDSFAFTQTFPQWHGGGWELAWEKVIHQFKAYGKGVCYVRFADAGKDTKWWAGHYGSKMAAACVRIRFNSCVPDVESKAQ